MKHKLTSKVDHQGCEMEACSCQPYRGPKMPITPQNQSQTLLN